MTVVDDYLKQATSAQLAEFERISKIAQEVIPDMEIVISYGVIAFKSGKKSVLYFGVYKTHMSLYPASDEMAAAVGEEVARRRVSKGTLHFNEKEPIPEPALREIIEFRLASPR